MGSREWKGGETRKKLKMEEREGQKHCEAVDMVRGVALMEINCIEFFI